MKPFFSRFTRSPKIPVLRADAALAVLLIAILALMVLPMPTLLVDILIGVNLAIALILLVVALHLSSPLKISSFPSILLVATLFRLALSISTTRLILLQGDAGHVVETFGMFVVGGNIIVGLIIFLILTLVQFIVITKGSERVAEVSARFSLDGMPGKQMAIDGDLRANVIDKDEAKARRTHIELESQFYGSMDGAMKFVKGDAIAGLIIVAVNLLGGIGVAVLQQGLDMSTAMQKYSILTIGDGLVSQLPALLISIAAGLIVTRVTGQDSKTNVGRDIARQIASEPKALLFSGLTMGGMAAVPGMPTAAFAILAGILAGSSLIMHLRQRRSANAQFNDTADSPLHGMANGTSPSSDGPSFSVPLILSLSKAFRNRYGMPAITQAVQEVRRAKSFALGVPFPDILVRQDDELHGFECRVHCNEVPVSDWRIPEGRVLAQGLDADYLAILGVNEDPCGLGNDFPLSYWIEEPFVEEAIDFGAAILRDLDIFRAFLGTILDRHAAEFLGLHETAMLLLAFEKTSPDLVKEVDRFMPKQRLADVLQRLVSEGIPIRNLKGILETMARWGQKEKDPVVLTEYARADMKRQIAHKYAQSRDTLSAYLVSPGLEEALRQAVRQTSAGSYVVLPADQQQKLVKAVRDAVGDLRDRQAIPVLLTAMDIRRYLRKLIENDCPELAVLAFQELPSEIQIHAIGQIDVEL